MQMHYLGRAQDREALANSISLKKGSSHPSLQGLLQQPFLIILNSAGVTFQSTARGNYVHWI